MYARQALYSIAAQAPALPDPAPDLPGRPLRPELRHHTAVARRSPATLEGRAVLIHAIADRKSTRLNSSHLVISYAVFCLKKKKDSPCGPRVAGPVRAAHFRALGPDLSGYLRGALSLTIALDDLHGDPLCAVR